MNILKHYKKTECFNTPLLELLMLNKIIIPAALVATVVIAGIFAFMPVEKASTVHGSLATSASITTLSNTVTSEADDQNRAIDFYFNLTHTNTKGPGGKNATIVLAEEGKTFTGYATITAIPNNGTCSSVVGGCASYKYMNCGLQTTGSDGTKNKLGLNATGGMTNSSRLGASNGLTVTEGIEVILANATGANFTGVCAGTLILTSWGS